jgi:cellulose synthase/poly-beta-1,6-N-acetylglucosamine synthase-like glycosyltransferase
MAAPIVSVIIPLKQLSYYLMFETLPALAQQVYKRFEVIILPNETVQYDLSLLRKYRWLRIVPTGKITRPAEKRDMGAKFAKGKIIAFIDDDAYPTPNWLKTALSLFTNSPVAAVCGPGLLPKNTNLWEKVFDEVLKTWVGSGGYSYRFVKQGKRYVDDYPSMNFLILKKIFNKLGGFNSNYWPGEDSKLCEDLVYKCQGKILYHPDIYIYHHRRNNLLGYLRQHANYGFHRGAFLAHGDKNSRRLSYLIPTLFILYLIVLILIQPLSSIFHFQIPASIFYLLSSPLLLYLIAEFYIFFKSIINTKSIIMAAAAPIVMFLTHLIYGIMFVKGFAIGLIKKKKIY